MAELSGVLNKEPQVLSLTPTYLADVLEDVRRVGEAAGVPDRAAGLVEGLQVRIDAVAARTADVSRRPRILQLEWVEPLLCGGHWVVEMVELAGGDPCFGSRHSGASRLEWDDVVASRPDMVLFMPCGFDLPRAMEDVPILTSLPGWSSLPAVQRGNVYVVDGGAYTSRLGPRLVTGLEILAELIQPDLFSGMIPANSVQRILSPG